MKWRTFALLSCLVFAAGVRADEIRLKDGSKIVGSVVGYEDGSFKVETAYGFAMVRKDSIAEIIPADSKPQPATPKAAPSKPAEEAAPSVKPAAFAEAKPQPATPAPKPSPTPAPQPAANAPAAAASRPATAANPAAAAAPASSASAAPTAVPAAATPALPAPAAAPPPPELLPVQETVRGNLYINQTYGFQMYRPPTWDLIADARAALPNAITALGTSDETTLFVVGRDRVHDSLDEQSAATEKALREIYENYRPQLSTRTTIGGLPAIERHFHGTLDKSDWSAVLVTLVRGNDVFTILAMTGADSDLVQFQENVIAKAIGSLQFTPPLQPAR